MENMNSVNQPTGQVHLVACPRPFSMQRIERELPEGGTIAEMFRAIDLDPGMLHARVFIDDRLILKAEWEHATPQAGQLVTVRVVPTGGGGGKDALRIVAMIGVVLASIWTAGGGLAGLSFLPEGLAMGLGSGTTAAYVAGAGVSLFGSLHANTMLPARQS